MACSLLLGETNHNETYDLESFIWVLCYSILRNLYERSLTSDIPEVRNEHKNLEETFTTAFGKISASDIADARTSTSKALQFPALHDHQNIYKAFMSDALITCLRRFGDLIKYGEFFEQPPGATPVMTYDTTVAILDNAISALK